jgi:RNA polymerase sigma-70 factor (ECF subfamily)
VCPQSQTSDGVKDGDGEPAVPQSDFEAIYRLHYTRIARAIARVVGDPACAEELATDVFWKFWRSPPPVQGEQAGGWLYRTAIRLAIGELRRRARHLRYQRLLRIAGPATPEAIRGASEEQEQVRQVLAAIRTRDAEMLLLRGEDFSYEDLARALDLNPASVGTLIGRARQAFRKEYTKRYGEPRMRS